MAPAQSPDDSSITTTIQPWVTVTYLYNERYCSWCGHSADHVGRAGGCLQDGCNCEGYFHDSSRVVIRTEAVRIATRDDMQAIPVIGSIP